MCCVSVQAQQLHSARSSVAALLSSCASQFAAAALAEQNTSAQHDEEVEAEALRKVSAGQSIEIVGMWWCIGASGRLEAWARAWSRTQAEALRKVSTGSAWA